MEIDAETGEITWQYGPEDKGDYKIGIEVADGDGGQAFQEMAITIN